MLREIESVADLHRHLEARASLDGCVVQGVDLTEVDLEGVTVSGCLLLGCEVPAETLGALVGAGALAFPRLPDLPYRPFRTALYTATELLGDWRNGEPGSFDRDSLDAAIYRHAVRHRVVHDGDLPLVEALARRLHDLSIDDALGELLSEHPSVVGIMGGHDLERSSTDFADIAALGRALAQRGHFVLTGGGPGAMEAGNFGAASSAIDDEAFADALAELAAGPSWREPDRWIATGLAVRDRLGDAVSPSLAVPTWFYGHEPTNVFATEVAKYFSNSLREDGLLAIATGGLFFAPGSAGTVQELFQDAAQNHYPIRGVVSPMVLLGAQYWTDDLPAMPLLAELAAGRPWADLLHLADDVEDALAFLDEHPPISALGP